MTDLNEQYKELARLGADFFRPMREANGYSPILMKSLLVWATKLKVIGLIMPLSKLNWLLVLKILVILFVDSMKEQKN